MKKVLIFPCGSEIGLEINRALRYSKDLELYGGSSVKDHGRFVYKNYIKGIPDVDSSDFIENIIETVNKYEIDFIFPAHDSVVLKLAENQDKIPAKVLTSPHETAKICRSKLKTYEYLSELIKTPLIYKNINEIKNYPVFIKPDVGQGSKGVLLATSYEEVKLALQKSRGLIVTEYLPYKEYTVDCFTDKNGELRFAQARERARTNNGISVNSKVANGKDFFKIAEIINKNLEFRGVWFFQVKEDAEHRLTLLEVAPRVAGTMALARMQGVNLPLLSIYDQMDIPISILKNSFEIEIDRALTNKFLLNIEYGKVYVDFDDALIINGQINELLIAFLYKCRNQNKKIILITKHTQDIRETLATYKISEYLFDEIVSIKKEDEKNLTVTSNSIFIDDSFSERKRVHDKLGVPVFDVSEAVELL